MGRWDIAGKVNGKDPYALYHWFLQFAPQILVGHRYFYMMCCVIYASKCGVPYQQLREDMKEVFERLLQIEHDNNPLTERDMKSALKIYKRDFYNITLVDIERMTGLRLPRNRRNGRTREKRFVTSTMKIGGKETGDHRKARSCCDGVLTIHAEKKRTVSEIRGCQSRQFTSGGTMRTHKKCLPLCSDGVSSIQRAM